MATQCFQIYTLGGCFANKIVKREKVILFWMEGQKGEKNIAFITIFSLTQNTKSLQATSWKLELCWTYLIMEQILDIYFLLYITKYI